MSYYLLLLCFVGFSVGQLVRISLGNGIAITLLDISVFLFIIYHGYLIVQKKILVHGKLAKPIAIFLFICLLSLIVNIPHLTIKEFFPSFLYLFRFVMYISLYFVLITFRIVDRKEFIKLFIISGSVHLLLGLMQYYFYPDLRQLYFLGWDDHLYRLVGAFIDPNFEGALFAMLFNMLFLVLWNKKNQYRSQEFLGFSILFIITLLALVLTYSRSALVMLIVSLVIYSFLLGNKKIFGAIGIVTFILIIIFSNITIEGINPLRTASVAARVSSIKEAFTIIHDNPIFGVGFNTFRYAQHRYGFRTSEAWQTSHADAGTDNSYLFVFATAGVFGFISFLYLLWSVLWFVVMTMKKESILPMVIFVSLCGLLLDSFFVNSLFYTFFLFWIWSMLGVMEST
jgi:O-antigen ligase